MARNIIAKKEYLNGGVRFTFGNGETREVMVADFPPEIVAALTDYGIGQKCGDAYSGDKTPEDALNSLDTVVAQLVAGNWRAASESGGPKAGKTVQALHRIGERNEETLPQSALRKVLGINKSADWTIPTVRDAFAKLDDDRRKAVMAAGEVKAELAQMQREAAESAGASLMNL